MSDVDRQIARAGDVLERSRERRLVARGRRKEGEVLRRVGRIVAADVAIIVAAMAVGWVVPLGMGGAMIVMALLIAATAFFAVYSGERVVRVDELGAVALTALPARTEAWLERQRPALPAPALGLVDAIAAKLDTLGAQLATLDEREPAAAEVRKLVGEQLPGLVEGYGRVPVPLRGVERNGRTPDAQLVDGLQVIDEELAKMSAQLAAGDLDLLATRGRYLEIRYREDGVA